MPTYEYRCAANGEVLEVVHPMSQTVRTWSELCEISGREPGKTAGAAPVERLISASAVHTPQTGEWKRTGKKPSAGHAHGSGCSCCH